jgi:hypothetical protein
MENLMKRTLTIIALLAAAAVTLGACSLGPLGGSAAPAPSNPPRLPARNGASGELVKMDGTTLVISSQNGDMTVLYNSSTTFQRTSIGTFADIAAGKCLVATGQKDSSGSITAASVRLTDKVSDTCTLGAGPGFGLNGGPGGGISATPRPAPPAGRPNFSVVAGEVTAVAGTSVTVKESTGASQTVTVPTTVRVSKSSPAAASDLTLHQCLTAAGSRDSSGKVTARSISIVPPGPSGCATLGRGFGGGGVFGGGGGGGPNGGGGGEGGDLGGGGTLVPKS